MTHSRRWLGMLLPLVLTLAACGAADGDEGIGEPEWNGQPLSTEFSVTRVVFHGDGNMTATYGTTTLREELAEQGIHVPGDVAGPELKEQSIQAAIFCNANEDLQLWKSTGFTGTKLCLTSSGSSCPLSGGEAPLSTWGSWANAIRSWKAGGGTIDCKDEWGSFGLNSFFTCGQTYDFDAGESDSDASSVVQDADYIKLRGNCIPG